MIEPITLTEQRVSPAERYAANLQAFRTGRSSQGNAAPEGSDEALGKNLPPGQAVSLGPVTRPGGVAGQITTEEDSPAKALAPAYKKECQTCKSRRYQDQSDDSGVSYQTPTKISPEKAGSAVMAHEKEHVSREKAKASREGRKIISQSVTIKTAICPECGRVYVSGGVTTTVTRAKEEENKFQVGKPTDTGGLFLDAQA